MSNALRGAIRGTLLILALLTTPAVADTIDFTNPAFAPVTGPTTVPIGHAEFCKVHKSECGMNARMVEVEALTEAKWAELVEVNFDLNVRIRPETDEDLYKVAEYWTYPDGRGDCEDIALAKRRQLIEMGWAPSTLLMTVVKEANGNGHAVLMVRTDRGDLVLDNQESKIMVWSQTPYTFVKRQSQADAGKWVGIADVQSQLVATK